MAQICLGYLLEPGLSNGPLNEGRLIEYRLAHYAARYWYDYYQKAGDRGSVDD